MKKRILSVILVIALLMSTMVMAIPASAASDIPYLKTITPALSGGLPDYVSDKVITDGNYLYFEKNKVIYKVDSNGFKVATFELPTQASFNINVTALDVKGWTIDRDNILVFADVNERNTQNGTDTNITGKKYVFYANKSISSSFTYAKKAEFENLPTGAFYYGGKTVFIIDNKLIPYDSDYTPTEGASIVNYPYFEKVIGNGASNFIVYGNDLFYLNGGKIGKASLTTADAANNSLIADNLITSFGVLPNYIIYFNGLIKAKTNENIPVDKVITAAPSGDNFYDELQSPKAVAAVGSYVYISDLISSGIYTMKKASMISDSSNIKYYFEKSNGHPYIPYSIDKISFSRDGSYYYTGKYCKDIIKVAPDGTTSYLAFAKGSIDEIVGYGNEVYQYVNGVLYKGNTSFANLGFYASNFYYENGYIYFVQNNLVKRVNTLNGSINNVTSVELSGITSLEVYGGYIYLTNNTDNIYRVYTAATTGAPAVYKNVKTTYNGLPVTIRDAAFDSTGKVYIINGSTLYAMNNNSTLYTNEAKYSFAVDTGDNISGADYGVMSFNPMSDAVKTNDFYKMTYKFVNGKNSSGSYINVNNVTFKVDDVTYYTGINNNAYTGVFYNKELNLTADVKDYIVVSEKINPVNEDTVKIIDLKKLDDLGINGYRKYVNVDLTNDDVNITGSGASKAANVTITDEMIASARKVTDVANGEIFNPIFILPESCKDIDNINVSIMRKNLSLSNLTSIYTVKNNIVSVGLHDTMLNNTSTGYTTDIFTLSISVADKNETSNYTHTDYRGKAIVSIKTALAGKDFAWSNVYSDLEFATSYDVSASERYADYIGVDYITSSPKQVNNGAYISKAGVVRFNAKNAGDYGVVYNFGKKSFVDLSKHPWAKESIELMASRGIINGISSNEYAPKANIKRADFIMMLMNTLDISAPSIGTFSDVKSTDYYYEIVGMAKTLKIAAGDENGKFNPNKFITREEMGAFTARALAAKKIGFSMGTSSDLNKFNDKSKIASWAINDMATMVKNGFLIGDAGNLNPKNNLTRAETAVFINNIFNYTWQK